MNTGEIIPVKKKVNNRNNAYEYLLDKNNSGNPMFFAWKTLDNKGRKIEYVPNSNIRLLTLDIPEDQIVKTNYYNWVDFIFFMEIDKGGPGTIEAVRAELGCDFDVFYNCIFRLDDGNKSIQYLLKKIKADWITKVQMVKDKII